MKPEFTGYFTAGHARVRRDLVKRLVMLLALPLAANWQPALANPAPVSPAGPIQIPVQCGSPSAPVKSITDALKRLGNFHPAVLLISGTCRENVTIQGLEDITLQGNPTATIDGGGNPDVGTFEIIASRNIALSNLTITGSSNDVGVDCVGFSYCLLTQVTLQNNGSGAAVGGGSRLECYDTVTQNNGENGLLVTVGSVAMIGGSISGNGSDGAWLGNGGTLVAAGGLTIQNNGGNGISTALHNTVTLSGATIVENAGDGVALETGTSLLMANSTISNNGGHQLRIGDLSVARFNGGNTIKGANYPDVVCDPQFSTTRHLAQLSGTTTNCPAEAPPTP